jgi:hypothetical protein
MCWAKGAVVCPRARVGLAPFFPALPPLPLPSRSQFYTLIPHACGTKAPPLLLSKAALQKKREMIEALIEIEIATKLMKGACRLLCCCFFAIVRGLIVGWGIGPRACRATRGCRDARKGAPTPPPFPPPRACPPLLWWPHRQRHRGRHAVCGAPAGRQLPQPARGPRAHHRRRAPGVDCQVHAGHARPHAQRLHPGAAPGAVAAPAAWGWYPQWQWWCGSHVRARNAWCGSARCGQAPPACDVLPSAAWAAAPLSCPLASFL